MRAAPIALAALLVSGAAALAVTDAELRSKIVGTWGDTATCAAGALIFNADGTFVSREKSGADELKGSYQIDGGKLNGKAEDREMPEMTVSFDGETLVMAARGGQDKLIRCTP